MDKARPAGGRRPPILDQISRKLPHWADQTECVARKYNCGSVWCPVCYRRFHLARHFARLSEMPWQESRLVTLTMDRDKFGSGADAYVASREKKMIGRFIVSLERQGVEVKDWAGQIEWHGDGTPHWHLLIRTKPGREGMIGQARIHKAWPWGRIIREDRFKNQKHYDNTVGYFGKAGYFHKGKKHQTILPDYFESEFFKGKRIMRFYSARRPRPSDKESVAPQKEPEKSDTITGRKLKTCGQSTMIWYYENDWYFEDCHVQTRFGEKIPVPYEDFIKRTAGEYLPGIGYNFWLSGKAPPEIPCPF